MPGMWPPPLSFKGVELVRRLHSLVVRRALGVRSALLGNQQYRVRQCLAERSVECGQPPPTAQKCYTEC